MRAHPQMQHNGGGTMRLHPLRSDSLLNHRIKGLTDHSGSFLSQHAVILKKILVQFTTFRSK